MTLTFKAKFTSIAGNGFIKIWKDSNGFYAEIRPNPISEYEIFINPDKEELKKEVNNYLKSLSAKITHYENF